MPEEYDLNALDNSYMCNSYYQTQGNSDELFQKGTTKVLSPLKVGINSAALPDADAKETPGFKK